MAVGLAPRRGDFRRGDFGKTRSLPHGNVQGSFFSLCVCVCVCVLFLFNRRVKLHTDRPPAAASPTGNLGCGTLEAKEPTAESHIEDGLFNGGGRKTVCWTGIENCALVGLLFPFKYPAVRVDDICKQWRLTRRPVCFT